MDKNLIKIVIVIVLLLVVLLINLYWGSMKANVCEVASCPQDCVSSPINEMVTMIQKAQSGIDTTTDPICINAGERFTDESLTTKVTNLNSVTFICKDAAVCNHDDPLKVDDSSIEAVGDARFKGLISCVKDRGTGDFDCTIEIQSA